MFEHSVKVPRHYKIAANIFKKVSTEGGSVKTLLYDDKLRHFRTNVLFALITETIKHAADIDKIFEYCKLLQNEPRFDPWLAKVLTAELLFGKKLLPGKSKPEQTILSYKEQFDKFVSEHQDTLKTEEISRPRYVRVNTNLLTTSDAIRAFQDEGFRFIRCTSGSYSDYLEQIQKIAEDEFTQDYHVKTVFVFAPGTKWHDHPLYLENQIILQDKATVLAVHLLAPPQGSTVLDMCAAPGMKTTQLAAYLRNDGKVYAVERNEQRYKTLCDFVEKTASKCVQTFHRDSLDIKKGEFDDVEYILLDPSCSGSGMNMSVHNYGPDKNRLDKLTSLQEKFLKHAMNAFPKAKRIVYSTCSLYPEENERVIANVVKFSRAKWRVQNVQELLKGQWNNLGSAMYGSTGTRCLYAKPDSDLTIGFFLAVLDRDEKDLAKAYRQEDGEAIVQKRADDKLKKSNNYDNDNVNDNNIDDNVNELTKEKSNKKDKKKRGHEYTDNNITNKEEAETEVKSKKKKKNKNYTDQTENATNELESVPQKKKRKHKTELSDHNDQATNNTLDNIEDLNEENQDFAGPKKKKKKKDKHKNDTEIICGDKYLENITEDLEGKQILKPKKIKKNKMSEDANYTAQEKSCLNEDTVDNVLSDNLKKRKKKKNKTKEIDE